MDNINLMLIKAFGDHTCSVDGGIEGGSTAVAQKLLPSVGWDTLRWGPFHYHCLPVDILTHQRCLSQKSRPLCQHSLVVADAIPTYHDTVLRTIQQFHRHPSVDLISLKMTHTIINLCCVYLKYTKWQKFCGQ